MSLMSVNWPQRVTSQFLGAPSISTMNSSTNPSLSRYFSRRCCLQMSAVCFWRFLVPKPIAIIKLYKDPRVGQVLWSSDQKTLSVTRCNPIFPTCCLIGADVQHQGEADLFPGKGGE